MQTFQLPLFYKSLWCYVEGALSLLLPEITKCLIPDRSLNVLFQTVFAIIVEIQTPTRDHFLLFLMLHYGTWTRLWPLEYIKIGHLTLPTQKQKQRRHTLT